MNRKLRNTVAGFTAAFLTFGAVAQAQSFEDKIVQNLQDLGYEYVEVKVGPTQVKAEGIKGSEKIEVVYDSATGEIIKQETERASEDEVGRTGVEIATKDKDFVDTDGGSMDGSDESDDDKDDDRDDDKDDDRDDDKDDDRDDDKDDDRDDDKDDDRDDDKDDDRDDDKDDDKDDDRDDDKDDD